ncbi:uncharacterized protein LOC126820659 isoform X2 [Patella vulgata]|nr:uncharacterized protein LOC126820659 isoform X2 [Patella vulgata]XP_050404726.1 uncharacterized protein LOC126820659 isoform X2 [Patella vulgata]XP_050404727.1 uncharacterized protein LOC126820659 isoform X2 [Patella vulgata]XP_050404729.1 uncharacterized protein LOC126820659 isoform X2 [Patella vulgata]XP_050404730.1 uncharacterized protein LOC126820659 isoform X2 [Patella vulgata]XP_050404731.1 uncharacterized protein LOC126820659 isoform X2 [Patella vulgata]
MSQVRHVIEHRGHDSFRPYHLPPIQQPYIGAPPIAAAPPAIMAPPPQQVFQQPAPQMIQQPAQQIIQAPPAPQFLQAPPPHIIQAPPVVQSMPAVHTSPIINHVEPIHNHGQKNTWFNKGDFMDMMMMQNAQMHHMAMQQLMINSLGGGRPAGMGGGERQSVQHHHYPQSAPAAPQMYHHQLPQMGYGMDMGGGYGRGGWRRRWRTGRNTAPVAVRTEDSKSLNRPSSVFLFGIVLKEIVAALHRIYLNPSGNIYPIFNDLIGPNAYNLSLLVNDRRGRIGLAQRDQAAMLQVLQYVMENFTYHMTEIMPATGVLGTHRKAAVFEMIKNNKRFPDGYFWQIELDQLQFNEAGRSYNLGNDEAFLLLVGIFISRSLITTLLLKPIDYGLSTSSLPDNAELNLKVFATIMLFLVRRSSVPRGRPMMPMPGEIARYVYSDAEFRTVHVRLRRSYEYCENLLRDWGQEYVKRLRNAISANPTKAPNNPIKRN